jgi:hypothetical protein
VIGTVAGVLVLYTSYLFFGGAFLAPRAEHRELEEIGERYSGQGPALVTEGSTYGARHFLRRLDAESARDLRRRTVALNDGGVPDDLALVDTDAIASASLEPYELIVTRRTPVASRPPGDFGLVESGDYYEVWKRGAEGAQQTPPFRRLPLGTPPLQSDGVPECAAVAALAAEVGAGGTLLAARPRDGQVLDLASAQVPDSWEVDSASRFVPDSSGRIEVPAELPRAGDYLVWVGGNIQGELRVSAGGETADPRRQALNQGLYEPFGPLALQAGPQTIELDYDLGGVHPGADTTATPIGPVILEREQEADRGTVSVPASGYERLCDESWDWIEARP